jgi:nanoRNase/pAp phosphatase (c-di-AMP/oligoRNAs hydrolase)
MRQRVKEGQVEEAAPKGNTRSGGSPASLGEYLETQRGERHLVVLQDYPDPDAISCSLAYRLIAAQYEIKVDIVYRGKVSHQQNIALVRLLNIPLITFTPAFDLSKYRGAVFLDNQGTTSNQIVQDLEEAYVPALIIIDHHEPQNRIQAEYTDIRRVGAAATLLTEYLQAGLVEMDRGHKEHVQVATALMHGIMTDTGSFSRAREQDLLACAYLSRYRDIDLLQQILVQTRSRQVMEIIHRALTNRELGESFSIAGVGYLREEDRDVIPQTADFLLTEGNVQTAIVYGIVTGENKEEKLIGSMRTSKLTLDPDEFIKGVLGKDARGYYFGGGKLSAGGFEIPVGFLSGGDTEGYNQIKWQVFDKQIKLRFFSKIGHIPLNSSSSGG